MKIECDVVIVGAGPCGLFQVFELGLLGISAHVVDALPHIGGQCATLYPEKPIYDIPALPVVGAQELVDRLAEQIAPFKPHFHLGEEVNALAPTPDGGFHLATSSGTQFATRAVIVAAGLGAFTPRRLRIEGAQRFEDHNLAYRITDKARYRGRRVVILGGGDSALDWALELHAPAASITLVRRREAFRAQPAQVETMQRLAEADPARMRHLVGNVASLITEGDLITGIVVKGPDETLQTIELDELLVFYGLSPDLGPIAEWGLAGDRRHIQVDTETFVTSQPGIFAIGDINTYPGKKKLILSGFHEAALAAFGVQRHLDPDARQHVQYTTTSPLLHKRLGVDPQPR